MGCVVPADALSLRPERSGTKAAKDAALVPTFLYGP